MRFYRSAVNKSCLLLYWPPLVPLISVSPGVDAEFARSPGAHVQHQQQVNYEQPMFLPHLPQIHLRQEQARDKFAIESEAVARSLSN